MDSAVVPSVWAAGLLVGDGPLDAFRVRLPPCAVNGTPPSAGVAETPVSVVVAVKPLSVVVRLMVPIAV